MEKDYKELSRRIHEAYEKENEFLKEEVLGRVVNGDSTKQNLETKAEKAQEEK